MSKDNTKFSHAKHCATNSTQSKFLELLNSNLLDVHKWSDYPEVRLLTDRVYSNIKTHLQAGGAKRIHDSKLKKHLRVVLVDLAYNYYTDKEKYIKYSRNRSDYRPEGRYNKLHIAYKPLIQVVDSLSALGYIEDHVGFYDSSKGEGFSSRMKHTPKLVDMLDQCGIDASMLGKHAKAETIILKDAQENLVEYSETLETESIRSDMQEYNLFLGRNVIAVSGKRLPQPFMCRIFNRDFNQGGRYYGGYWEVWPENAGYRDKPNTKYRKDITINGEGTSELDYSGLHINMLYNIKGLECKDDPYSLEGYPKTDKIRTTIKFATMSLINASNFESARKALQETVNFDTKNRFDRKLDIPKLLRDIQNRHKPIEDNFCSMAGTFLQNEDSKIMGNILKRCMSDNIVALPIHDSVRIPTKHKTKVENIMQEEYSRIFEHSIKIKS